MFHFWRKIHRTFGVVLCLFLLAISITGFLLALKREISWMRPSEKEGAKFDSPTELVHISAVLDAAFAAGLAELKTIKDVDRIDYRPKNNVFKVVSKQGYKEVQVDGTTGKVVNIADRNDTLVESLHDLSWFHELIRKFWLPVVAAGLGVLSLTGFYIYINPVLRRMRFKRQQGTIEPKPGAKA